MQFMLFTSRCQGCHGFAFPVWLLKKCFAKCSSSALCACVLSYRCRSHSHRLLCVSEEPRLPDAVLPMRPSSLFLLYPTVLQLLQPLLLCLHHHRVSQKLISFFTQFLRIIVTMGFICHFKLIQLPRLAISFLFY